MYMYYLLSFLDIDEEEIWEDFVKMIADNVENHSLSAFDIVILLLSSASKSEFRDELRDRTLLNSNQVIPLSSQSINHGLIENISIPISTRM